MNLTETKILSYDVKNYTNQQFLFIEVFFHSKVSDTLDQMDTYIRIKIRRKSFPRVVLFL